MFFFPSPHSQTTLIETDLQHSLWGKNPMVIIINKTVLFNGESARFLIYRRPQKVVPNAKKERKIKINLDDVVDREKITDLVDFLFLFSLSLTMLRLQHVEVQF
jgi:hypothetical protein